jgi:hypothetical protein
MAFWLMFYSWFLWSYVNMCLCKMKMVAADLQEKQLQREHLLPEVHVMLLPESNGFPPQQAGGDNTCPLRLRYKRRRPHTPHPNTPLEVAAGRPNTPNVSTPVDIAALLKAKTMLGWAAFQHSCAKDREIKRRQYWVRIASL